MQSAGSGDEPQPDVVMKKPSSKRKGVISHPSDIYENPVWHKSAHGWTIKYRAGAQMKKTQAMSVSWPLHASCQNNFAPVPLFEAAPPG